MSKKKKLLKEAFVAIASEFNYEEIHEYYNSVDWRWSGVDSELGVPSPDHLYDTALRLIGSLVDGDYGCVSSGGITIRKTDSFLMIYFNDHKNLEKMRFGRIHDWDTDLSDVSAYWTHIEKKMKKEKK